MEAVKKKSVQKPKNTCAWFVPKSATPLTIPVARSLSYTRAMRPLWPIEREILEITTEEYPSSAATLRHQIDTAVVSSFENSGAGFFSELVVAADAPVIPGVTMLDPGFGAIAGIEDAMAFIVFLRDGRIAMIEGYCQALESTAEIDFSRVDYRLTRWSQP